MKKELVASIIIIALCYWRFPEQLMCCSAVILIGLSASIRIRKKYKQTKSRQLLSFYPSVWTALGILGTFISIILTLSASSDFSNIARLVSNISPAFGTSAVGVLMSIISSLDIKYIYASEDALEDKTYNESANVTPEIVLVNLYKSHQLQIEESQKQTQETINAVNQLKASLENALGENGDVRNILAEYKTQLQAQNSTIERFVTNLIEKLGEYYGNVLNKTEEASKKLIEEHFVKYEKNLQEYNKLISDNLVKSVKDHEEALEETRKSILEGSKAEFDVIFNTYFNSFQDIATAFQNKTEETTKTIAEAMVKMQESNNKLDNLLQTHSEEVSKRIESESNNLMKISKSLEESFKKHTASTEKNVQTMSDSQRVAIERFKEETQTSLKNVATALVDTTKEGLSNEFTKLIGEVTRTTQKLHDDIAKYKNKIYSDETDRFNAICQSVDGKISESIEKLSGSIATESKNVVNIHNEVEQSQKNVLELTEAIQDLLKKLEVANKRISDDMTIIESSSQNLPTLAQYIQDSTDAINKLQHQLVNMTEGYPVEEVNGVKICPICHSENPGDARFCHNCRTKLS